MATVLDGAATLEHFHYHREIPLACRALDYKLLEVKQLILALFPSFETVPGTYQGLSKYYV